MKDEQIPVHQLDHAEPTVIHHPEEDMTVLARWLQRGMEQGSRFWLLVGGVIVLLVAIALLGSGLAAGKSSNSEAWIDVTLAKTVEDRIKIAETHPNTPVAYWSKLFSAHEEYAYGLADLTSGTRKDTAGPRLLKALKLFQEVAKEAPKDSPQKLEALFGAARTLEARNELPDAIEQYRDLATKYPNTPEAKQALALARSLEEPVNVQFYKELYDYKAPATPPPGTIGGPGSMFNNLISPGGGNTTRPPGFDQPVPSDLAAPPATTPTPVIPPPAETPKADAPKPETPKAEAPKAEAPKVETPAAPAAPAAPVETPKTASPPK